MLIEQCPASIFGLGKLRSMHTPFVRQEIFGYALQIGDRLVGWWRFVVLPIDPLCAVGYDIELKLKLTQIEQILRNLLCCLVLLQT